MEGVLDCPDRAVAIRQIEQLHYMPVRIELVASAPAVASKSQKNGAPAPVAAAPITAAAPTTPPQKLKLSHSQLLIFTEQLAHLLRAGMTLDESAPALSIVRATSVVIRRSIAVPPGPGYDRPSLAKSTDAFTASGPCPPHSAELVRPGVGSL